MKCLYKKTLFDEKIPENSYIDNMLIAIRICHTEHPTPVFVDYEDRMMRIEKDTNDDDDSDDNVMNMEA